MSDYRARQSRMNGEYEDAWSAWWRGLSEGERAGLQAKGIDRPWVERGGFGCAQEARDERDLQERLPELAMHERTPDVEMVEAEEEAALDDGLRAERLRQALRGRHFHFFSMFMGTGAEQYELLRLRAVIILRHAAPALLARFGLVNGSVKREIKRLRAGLRALHDYIPLADILCGATDEDETSAAAEIDVDVRALRLARFGEFCEEIGERSGTLDQWVKNAVEMIASTKPDEMIGIGISQSDRARKFGEERATVCARRMRVVEAPLKQSGAAGFHLLGGTKSERHRARCAKAQRGNKNRRNAGRRMRDEG